MAYTSHAGERVGMVAERGDYMRPRHGNEGLTLDDQRFPLWRTGGPFDSFTDWAVPFCKSAYFHPNRRRMKKMCCRPGGWLSTTVRVLNTACGEIGWVGRTRVSRW